MKRMLLAALAAALLVPATADAAAKRVVAIEWDTVENLHMLGMAPVGAADMKGYDTWVAAPRPKGMKDVGSRQSPSLERIAALQARPDRRARLPLDQEPRRSSSGSRPCSSRTRTRRSGTQFNAMVTDFRRLADAVGRREPRRARAAGPQQQPRAPTRRKLARAKRAGQRGGDRDARAARRSAPAIRMFTPELADRRRRAPARPARRLERAAPATASRRSASRASRA